MFDIRSSQMDFYSKFGTAKPVDLARTALSDDQYLINRVKFMTKTAPHWAKPALRRTFVGHTPIVDTCNVITPNIGSAYIGIFPRMRLLVDCSVWLYLAVLEITQDAVKAVQTGRRSETDAVKFGEGWRNIPLWLNLIHTFATAPAEIALVTYEHMYELSKGLPQVRKNAISEIAHYSWCAILGHEYGHILLGHTEGTKEQTIKQAQSVVKQLVPAVANEEIACDVLGFYLATLLPSQALIEPAKIMRRMAVGLQASIVINLAMQVIGNHGIFADVQEQFHHPSPEERYRFSSEAIMGGIRQTFEHAQYINDPAAKDLSSAVCRLPAESDTIQSLGSMLIPFVREVQDNEGIVYLEGLIDSGT